MKNILFSLFLVLSLCGFSSILGSKGSIEVESKNKNWDISIVSNAVVKAFNSDSQTEFLINLSDIIPSSPYCISDKKVKDIKIDISINKVAEEGESNWEKAFEKTQIYFLGKKDSEKRKIYTFNLLENSYRAKEGPISVGKIEFLSPINCNDIDNMVMKISGMKNGNKTLPMLDFTVKLPKQ